MSVNLFEYYKLVKLYSYFISYICYLHIYTGSSWSGEIQLIYAIDTACTH